MTDEASTLVRPTLPEGITARRALRAAAASWFITAVAGQWLFVYYIVGFYGLTLASGDFEAWDRNKNLTDGYIPGDAAGNAFFLAHVLMAAVLTFGGTLQLVPQLRERVIAVHRWNGRIFLVTAIAATSAGLYLQWVRGTALHGKDTGIVEALGTTLDGVLVLAFAGLAWRAVRAKNIDAHQRWATRLFLVVNGVWFLRVGFRAWMVLTAGAFGGQPFFSFWSFGAYLVPLAVYEMYRRTKTGPVLAQYAMAAALVALAIITGVGEAAAFFHNWLPLLLF